MDLEPLEETRETLLAMGGWSGKALMADLTRQGMRLLRTRSPVSTNRWP